MAQSDWSKTSSRDVCIQVNSDFQLCSSLFGWILKIQWKYQWKTLVHLKEVFMILHYKRTRI